MMYFPLMHCGNGVKLANTLLVIFRWGSPKFANSGFELT